MRRNETVLVYAVTGLLVVILAVAVIFGEEPAQGASSGDSTPVVTNEADGKGLLETDAADLGITPVKPPPVKPPPGPGDLAKGAPEVDPGVKAGIGPGDDPKRTPEEERVPGEAPREGPGDVARDVARDVALDVAPVPLVTRTIADQVDRVLGTSQREGDYRVVTARRDDRLSTLVERWCGNLEALPLVEALNEDLKQGRPIPAGEKVLVPWTEDEILLEAYEERKKELARIERRKGALYTLKKGDSLWKIAVGRVGSRQAPAYIRAIVQNNPQLEDPNAVREGQRIRLPPPGKAR